MDCLFCKIINKEIPAKVVYEDDGILAFNDINPRAPVHVLFIPKKHIDSLRDVKDEDEKLLGKMFLTISKAAKSLGIDKDGYRIEIANGKNAGQEVMHMHFHLLGGWKSND
ncbi:MAG: histidine triad nucleotide-binding protein [Candidatus Gottesmanbacteria bacterium]